MSLEKANNTSASILALFSSPSPSLFVTIELAILVFLNFKKLYLGYLFLSLCMGHITWINIISSILLDPLQCFGTLLPFLSI